MLQNAIDGFMLINSILIGYLSWKQNQDYTELKKANLRYEVINDRLVVIEKMLLRMTIK